MTPKDIERLFTRPDGSYQFARWGRPIVPVVFGVDDSTLPIIKGAIEAVVTLAGHKMAEADVELGANLMVFFFRSWEELPQVPGLDHVVPELVPLCARLAARDASQYRLFRFDPEGAIRAAFVFVRMQGAMAGISAEDIALVQATQMICLWSEGAFADRPALTLLNGAVLLRPEIAGLIRAAYDPVLPDHSTDASHALRLFGRVIAAKV